MVFKDLPPKVGTCPICTINLYGEQVTEYTDSGILIKIIGRPMVFPCGVGLFRKTENRFKIERRFCPFETETDQQKMMEVMASEIIAGLLGTQHGD